MTWWHIPVAALLLAIIVGCLVALVRHPQDWIVVAGVGGFFAVALGSWAFS